MFDKMIFLFEKSVQIIQTDLITIRGKVGAGKTEN